MRKIIDAQSQTIRVVNRRSRASRLDYHLCIVHSSGLLTFVVDVHAHAARAHSPYSRVLCADVRVLKAKVFKSAERRTPVFKSAAMRAMERCRRPHALRTPPSGFTIHTWYLVYDTPAWSLPHQSPVPVLPPHLLVRPSPLSCLGCSTRTRVHCRHVTAIGRSRSLIPLDRSFTVTPCLSAGALPAASLPLVSYNPSCICVCSLHWGNTVSSFPPPLHIACDLVDSSPQPSAFARDPGRQLQKPAQPLALVPYGCCGTGPAYPSSPTPLWSARANSGRLPSNPSYAPPGVRRTSSSIP